MPDPDKIVFINDTDTGFFRLVSVFYKTIETRIDNFKVEELVFNTSTTPDIVIKTIGSNTIAATLGIIAPGNLSSEVRFQRSSTDTLGAVGIYSDNELALKKSIFIPDVNNYVSFDVLKTKIYNHPNHLSSKVLFKFHLVTSKTTSHPANPEEGQIYYNTTDSKFYFFENGAWKTLGIETISGTANRLACFDDSGVLTASSWTHTSANSGSDFAIRYHTGSTSLSYLGVFSIGNTSDNISTIRSNFTSSSIRVTGITNGFVFASHGVHLLASNDYSLLSNRGVGFLNTSNQYVARILADPSGKLRIFCSNATTYDFTVTTNGISVGLNDFSSSVTPGFVPNIQSRQNANYSSLLLQVASNLFYHFPIIAIARSRGSITSMSSIINNDTIGRIDFYATRPGVSNADEFTDSDICFRIECSSIFTMSSYNPSKVLPTLQFRSITYENNLTQDLSLHLAFLPVYSPSNNLNYTHSAVYIH
ncbi:MAG: hypothetical protein NZ108_09280, partial [Bacteroidia bacterium]|nr:hypothetical protein [Bacteroidia bacterium]